MTLLDEPRATTAPRSDAPAPRATVDAAMPCLIEEAVARLVEAVDAPILADPSWTPAEIRRWVAAQPDPERALGQLVRAAGRVAFERPDPAPAIDVAEAPPAPGPRAARPVAEPEGLSAARRRGARICLWIRNAGCLLLVFLAYQWWGTGFEQHRSQAELRRSFSPASLVTPPADGVPPAGTIAGTEPAEAPAPLPGSAVAHLEIPAIGLDEYVVEGTGEADLKKGPGHYSGSPLPGQAGNAAIAGHRTTYGAPFGRLDDLKAGDTIVATTSTGRSVYTVSTKLTVLPSQTSIIEDYGDNRLTLTTCTPKFSASHRLIVVATLQGQPSGAPGPPARPAATSVAPAEPEGAARPGAVVLGGGDGGFHGRALPAAALSALALMSLGLLYRPVRRRWPPLAAAAVLAPLWLGGLLMFCEALNRFLPSNV
jgi:sortase A